MEETQWVLGPGDGSSSPDVPRPDLTALYRRFAPRLLEVVRGIVSVPAEAEDVAQEIWLGVHRNFSARGLPAPSWSRLERIARAAARRHVHRREAQGERPLGVLPLFRRIESRMDPALCADVLDAA